MRLRLGTQERAPRECPSRALLGPNVHEGPVRAPTTTGTARPFEAISADPPGNARRGRRENAGRRVERSVPGGATCERLPGNSRVDRGRNRVQRRASEHDAPNAGGRECPSRELLGPNGKREPKRESPQQLRERHVRSTPAPRDIEALVTPV